MSTLTAAAITALFKDLNERLAQRKVKGELCIVGGAVMCLVFKTRPATKDIDAAFAPAKIIREIAQDLAVKQDLPEGWLNDGVKGFLSEKGQFEPFMELSNLKIFNASAEYMLALKAISMRLGAEFSDEADLRYLLRHLEIQSTKKALEVITTYFPEDQIPQKTFYALEDLLTPTMRNE